MSVAAKQDLDYITDTFTGADGGVAFVKFRVFLEEMQRRAENGDKAASEVVWVMRRFASLIKLANRSPSMDEFDQARIP